MATLKTLAVTGPNSGSAAAAATQPGEFIRKQEFDAVVGPLAIASHAAATVEDTNSIDLTLVSGTQLFHAVLRRKTSSLATNQGMLSEDPNGVFVMLGIGGNQAAKGTDMGQAQIDIAGKAPLSHSHAIADVVNLQITLDGKAAVNHGHSVATGSTDGFMSAADKTKLDALVGGGGGTATKFNATFGDGILASFNITHALGTEDVIVQVRRTAAPKDVVECDVSIVDANNVLLGFAAAPVSGSLRVTIL